MSAVMEFGRRPVSLIEIDQPFCALTYGEGDCRAEIGDAGSRQISPHANISRKCFNTLGTCQDGERFLDIRDDDPPSTKVLRFCEDISGVPESLGAIPSILSVDQTPVRINPGGIDQGVSPLGRRAVLTVTLRDHPGSDLGLDPYLSERGYIASDRGTFWGKWMYRNLYRQGIPIRYRSGYIVDDEFVELTRCHYFLQKVDGPSASGVVTLQAFDVIKFLEAANAVYPSSSSGVLAGNMTSTAISFTLTPTGIGDLEYPASFRCRIGGEGFNVTRVGDACTITGRGLYGGASTHSAGDSVQVVAVMEGQIHDVAYDIITGAVPLMADYINKSEWDALAAQLLPRVYAADITEPTSVEQLLQELSESSPAYWWADVRDNRLKLGAIRPPSEAGQIISDEGSILAGTLSKGEFPNERVDEVWVYYIIRDPAQKQDDQSNYARRFILVNPLEQARQGRRSIRRVLSRWVSGLDAAEELAQSYISRFQETPTRISFDLDARQADLWVGSVIRPMTRLLQDDTGERYTGDYQIIEAKESLTGTQLSYTAQSYGFFDPVDPDFLRIRIIPEDTVNPSTGIPQKINLRELYDSTVGTEVPEIEVIVLGGTGLFGGTLVGGSSTSTAAVSLEILDEWDWDPEIRLIIEPGGAVVGQGGSGSGRDPISGAGFPGRTALYVRYNIDVINRGIIGGGGGGGGAAWSGPDTAGGGGGSGRVAGSGSDGGTAGSLFMGGFGGYKDAFGGELYGGAGGWLGEDGEDGYADFGSISLGGLAGAAVDGDSYVTWVVEGDIYGARIN
jgi:hypothetical protein